MNHIIKVTVDQDTVTADPNPAPGLGYTIKPGETVTWYYDSSMELQVIFSKFSKLPLANPPVLEDANPYGPFSSLTVVVGGGQTLGTIRSDVPTTDQGKRYFYKIIRNGKTLKWKVGVPGGDEELGGGIDIPMNPPGPSPSAG